MSDRWTTSKPQAYISSRYPPRFRVSFRSFSNALEASVMQFVLHYSHYLILKLIYSSSMNSLAVIPHLISSCTPATPTISGSDGRGRRKAVVPAYIRVTDSSEPPAFDTSHYYFSISGSAQPGKKLCFSFEENFVTCLRRVTVNYVDLLCVCIFI